VGEPAVPEPDPAPPSVPTQDRPLDVHGLTVWVTEHEGRSVLFWDGHPGEYHSGKQLDEFLEALERLRPHLTD